MLFCYFIEYSNRRRINKWRHAIMNHKSKKKSSVFGAAEWATQAALSWWTAAWVYSDGWFLSAETYGCTWHHEGFDVAKCPAFQHIVTRIWEWRIMAFTIHDNSLHTIRKGSTSASALSRNIAVHATQISNVNMHFNSNISSGFSPNARQCLWLLLI